MNYGCMICDTVTNYGPQYSRLSGNAGVSNFNRNGNKVPNLTEFYISELQYVLCW